MRFPLLIAAATLAACSGPGNDGSSTDNAVVNVDAIDSARDQGVPTPAPEPIDAPANQVTPLPSPEPTVDNRSTARYRCIDGGRLVVNYDPDNRKATVLRAGKQLAVLDQQKVASGISYAGGGYEFSGKGYDMSFTAPGQPPLPCTAIR